MVELNLPAFKEIVLNGETPQLLEQHKRQLEEKEREHEERMSRLQEEMDECKETLLICAWKAEKTKKENKRSS